MLMVLAVLLCYLSSTERRLETFWPECNLNPEVCDAGAVLYQFSYQAKRELVMMWVNDKLVDSGYM